MLCWLMINYCVLTPPLVFLISLDSHYPLFPDPTAEIDRVMKKVDEGVELFDESEWKMKIDFFNYVGAVADRLFLQSQ